ncbi:Hypothetical predicted protein, partial [Paramuricea clavata]
MVGDTYNDELWYANFRVTKETCTFILRKIEPEIPYENTHLREAVSAKRRLAVTLYYLASTAEYRTIGNLFGVSRSFVCQCIKETDAEVLIEEPILPIDETPAPDAELIRDALAEYFT